MKSPSYIPVSDLTYMSVGLPGQNKDASGKLKNWTKSCGVALSHGSIKASLDASTVFRAKEQFIHCDCMKCPNCLYYNAYVKSREPAERIISYRDYLAQSGYTPVIYHIVLSPPQPDKDKMAYIRWFSKEGYEDCKKVALIFLNNYLKSLGGRLVTHHFRQNGKDGMANAPTTGNDGDPSHWRVGLHFHAIAIFDGYVPKDQLIKKIYNETGWTVKVVLPPKKTGETFAEQLRRARLKTLDDVLDKIFYLTTHESIMEGDDGSRIYASTPFGGLSHRKFRMISGPANTPIFKEGYIETNDKGDKLYWYDDLLRFAPRGLEHLAEVERVNSAYLYCSASDYRDCLDKIIGLCRSEGIPLRYRSVCKKDRKTGEVSHVQQCLGPAKDIPPEVLYNAIIGDDRFFSTFQPINPDCMRSPRPGLVDGSDLWVFRDQSEFTPDQSPEYLEYCREADRREAEILDYQISQKIRYNFHDDDRYDNPREAEGVGGSPTAGGPNILDLRRP